jgi:hypothetical protein
MNILKRLLGFRTKELMDIPAIRIAAKQLEVGETLTFGDEGYVLERTPDEQGIMRRYTIKDANGRWLCDTPEISLHIFLRDLLPY